MMLYVHIPFCVKKCNYCDFLSFCANDDEKKRYIDTLCREIRVLANQIPTKNMTSVFIGGGTPSVLPIVLMETLLSCIQDAFHIHSDAEITIECNPGTVNTTKLLLYRKLGINRISFGLQSAQEDELALLGRIHRFEDFLKSYEDAISAGFQNVNVDLMYALPYQTTDKLHATLKKVLRLRPAHISAYALMIEEGTPFYASYQKDLALREKGLIPAILPSEETLLEMDTLVQAELSALGYHPYEISNYAKEGFACRHNIGYWKRTPYLGVGLGSASFYDHKRFRNPCKMQAYEKMVENLATNQTDTRSVTPISKQDAMAEFFFLGLRMKEGVLQSDFFKEFKVSAEDIYQKELSFLKEQGLLEITHSHIYLTKKGLDISNYALSFFLQEENDDAQRKIAI